MSKMRRREIDPIELRQISLEALVDERTTRRLLEHGPRAVRVFSRARIERVLRERGLLHLVPKEDAG
jgi:hypothetical protein